MKKIKEMMKMEMPHPHPQLDRKFNVNNSKKREQK